MKYLLNKLLAPLLVVGASSLSTTSYSQNALLIPDTLSGESINLFVQIGQRSFFPNRATPTYGYNGNFLGPTLLINKGDSITLNVKNQLSVPTTVHWHGFHVAPEHDGGPHQVIMPNQTWSPRFKMLNEAATFWYHPHGEAKTEIQVSKGLAGLIIVRDSTEATLALPRRYGLDDFPLIVQSKAFDVLQQIATATHEDSVVMVNGTLDPFLSVPKQVVRLRLLNASADRTYLFGMSDNSNFQVIGSDGGLLSAPHQTKRVRLSTGERVEILVDFGVYSIGEKIYLKSYSSELDKGIIGADSVGTNDIVMGEGYYENPLNGADFNLLRFDVANSTDDPITSIPASLVNRPPFTFTPNRIRVFTFVPDTLLSGQAGYVDGPFYINNQPFSMDSINHVTYMNDTEVWQLENNTLVAHPFHIHDVQFHVLDINGLAPSPEYQGLKDVILVKPAEKVRFITRFEDFADPMIPYMYHCHLLHHEDEGMMGSFLVLDTTSTTVGKLEPNIIALQVYPNPASNSFTVEFGTEVFTSVVVYNAVGIEVRSAKIQNAKSTTVDLNGLPLGVYVVKTALGVRRIVIQ